MEEGLEPLVACQNFVCIYHILFTCPSICGFWTCFRLLAVVHSDAKNGSRSPPAADTYFWLSTLGVLIVRLSWALKTDSKAQPQLQESFSSMFQLDSDKSHLATKFSQLKRNTINQIKTGFPLFSIDTRRERLGVWACPGWSSLLHQMGPPGISQPSILILECQSH